MTLTLKKQLVSVKVLRQYIIMAKFCLIDQDNFFNTMLRCCLHRRTNIRKMAIQQTLYKTQVKNFNLSAAP